MDNIIAFNLSINMSYLLSYFKFSITDLFSIIYNLNTQDENALIARLLGRNSRLALDAKCSKRSLDTDHEMIARTSESMPRAATLPISKSEMGFG